ncbi:MAG: hypothetical protein K6G09_08895, partial [Treponema sp.]|nr:hypothetical protein [Treponema sp.]
FYLTNKAKYIKIIIRIDRGVSIYYVYDCIGLIFLLIFIFATERRILVRLFFVARKEGVK